MNHSFDAEKRCATLEQLVETMKLDSECQRAQMATDVEALQAEVLDAAKLASPGSPSAIVDVRTLQEQLRTAHTALRSARKAEEEAVGLQVSLQSAVQDNGELEMKVEALTKALEAANQKVVEHANALTERTDTVQQLQAKLDAAVRYNPHAPPPPPRYARWLTR